MNRLSLRIITSIALKLYFLNIVSLSCCFFFSFIIGLYFLISIIIAQIFIPAGELVIPTGRATYEANAEIETQPITAETKITKCST